MRQLGISIYPEKATFEELQQYLYTAKEFGATRIFSCLLSAKESKEEIQSYFKKIGKLAKELGFELIIDVSPRVFKTLDISYQDLTFFKEIYADGIRLDIGFTGNEEAMMTYNPFGLDIEINMSNDVSTINTIMDYRPNRYHLRGCHNFYPHPYTGLDLPFFLNTSKRFQQFGLKTAAFVTSQNENTYGAWPLVHGLPTLEMHRHLPLTAQIKHLIALDCIDDIIISNCFPSQQEIDQLKTLDLQILSLSITLEEQISDVERKILLEEMHMNRGDHNDYAIRSTQSRVKYAGHHFPIWNAPQVIHPGDIVIESSEYGHYAGEVQIARKEMINSGKSNVVGHIKEEEKFLLDQIQPWTKFKLTL